MAVKRYGFIVYNEKNESEILTTDINNNSIEKTYLELLDNITSSLENFDEFLTLYKDKMPNDFEPTSIFIHFMHNEYHNYKYTVFNNKLIYQVSSLILNKIKNGEKDLKVPIKYIYDNNIIGLMKSLYKRCQGKEIFPYRIQELFGKYYGDENSCSSSEYDQILQNNDYVDRQIVHELINYTTFREVVGTLNDYYNCFEFSKEDKKELENANIKKQELSREEEIKYLSYIEKVIKIYGFDEVNSKNFFKSHEFVDGSTGRLVTQEEIEEEFEKYKQTNKHI